MPELEGDKPLTAQRLLTQFELESIGCMTYEASQLEEYVDDLFHILMRGEKKIVEMIVPENTTLGVKAKLLKELIHARIDNTEILSDYQPIHERISHAIARRNVVVHGVWRGEKSGFVGSEGPYRTKSTIAVEKKRRPEIRVNGGEIMLIAKALSDCCVDLIGFYRRHSAFLE